MRRYKGIQEAIHEFYFRVTYGKEQLQVPAALFMLFMSMGWDYISELRPETGILFIPQVIQYMSTDNHGEMISTGKTPDLSITVLFLFYQQPSSSEAG
jgi:hypothetical protein